ncbi:hypothetical protein HMI54_009359 [Coelomomyces lativittatus]|nr:hypothetical protein HMI54_009359 [Coelomomyces lativittatus]KAJ1503368.1 hypothetical protein HMI55_002486 [Coelomomyces lativittatus]KAJ1504631.1 hypothetical protein HMI56_001537 [Coelomomyces lativittatus]
MSAFSTTFQLKRRTVQNTAEIDQSSFLKLPAANQPSIPKIKNPFYSESLLNPFLNEHCTPTEISTEKKDTPPLLSSSSFFKSHESFSSPSLNKDLYHDEYQESMKKKEEETSGLAPHFCPSAVPVSFIESFQATMLEVNQESSTMTSSTSSTFMKHGDGKKSYFSSSTTFQPKAFTKNVNESEKNPSWLESNSSGIWNPKFSLRNSKENNKFSSSSELPLKGSDSKVSLTLEEKRTVAWKHCFPRGWYISLKKFLARKFPDSSEFASYQMYVVDDNWSELSVKCTTEQSEKLDFAMLEFSSLYVRSDLYILYQPGFQKKSNASLRSSQEPTLVAWETWPHPVTPDLDCCVFPFYSLVKKNFPSNSSFLFNPSLLSQSVWPKESIRSRQRADLFTVSSFGSIMDQLQMYLTYFQRAHPFSFSWKLTGSLGKHIVSSDHFLPPNQPDTLFPLTSIQERYSRETLKGSFAFNVWHASSLIHETLLHKAGFTLKSSVQYLIMDLPSVQIPKNYARAKFKANGAGGFQLKSVQTKDVVPVKLTLSFTDQVYDLRVRLVFKKTKEPIDLSEIQEKAMFLSQHGLQQYHQRFKPCSDQEEKIWIVQTRCYSHPTWPVKIKFSCWKSAKHPPYFTLQCNYIQSSSNGVPSCTEGKNPDFLRTQVEEFLETLFQIAFLFPKST